IIAACERAGVRCTIAFTQRWRRCNRAARQYIQEGQLGRILQMRETALVPTGLSGLPKWQSQAENLGTLFAHGVHNFDRVRWLTGQEIRTIYAKSCTMQENTAVEGSSMVLMTLADGTMVEFWCSFQIPKPSFPHSQFAAWVVGEKGLMDIDAYGETRVSAD